MHNHLNTHQWCCFRNVMHWGLYLSATEEATIWKMNFLVLIRQVSLPYITGPIYRRELISERQCILKPEENVTTELEHCTICMMEVLPKGLYLMLIQTSPLIIILIQPLTLHETNLFMSPPIWHDPVYSSVHLPGNYFLLISLLSCIYFALCI